MSAPSIVVQPEGAIVPSGNSYTLSVTAVGSNPLSYQWKKDGSNISGATASNYVISSVTTSACYGVVVSNAYGNVASNIVPVSAATTQDFQHDNGTYGSTSGTGLSNISACWGNRYEASTSTQYYSMTGFSAYFASGNGVATNDIMNYFIYSVKNGYGLGPGPSDTSRALVGNFAVGSLDAFTTVTFANGLNLQEYDYDLVIFLTNQTTGTTYNPKCKDTSTGIVAGECYSLTWSNTGPPFDRANPQMTDDLNPPSGINITINDNPTGGKAFMIRMQGDRYTPGPCIA